MPIKLNNPKTIFRKLGEKVTLELPYDVYNHNQCWMKEGAYCLNNEDKNNLEIRNITLADIGTYICTYKGSEGRRYLSEFILIAITPINLHPLEYPLEHPQHILPHQSRTPTHTHPINKLPSNYYSYNTPIEYDQSTFQQYDHACDLEPGDITQ